MTRQKKEKWILNLVGLGVGGILSVWLSAMGYLVAGPLIRYGTGLALAETVTRVCGVSDPDKVLSIRRSSWAAGFGRVQKAIGR